MKNKGTITFTTTAEGPVNIAFDEDMSELSPQLYYFIIGLTKVVSTNPYEFMALGKSLVDGATEAVINSGPELDLSAVEVQGNA